MEKKPYETLSIGPAEMVPMAVSMVLKVFQDRGKLTDEDTNEFARLGDKVLMALLRGDMVTVKDGEIVAGAEALALLNEQMAEAGGPSGVVVNEGDED